MLYLPTRIPRRRTTAPGQQPYTQIVRRRLLSLLSLTKNKVTVYKYKISYIYIYIDILLYLYLLQCQPLFREQVRLNGAVTMDFCKKKKKSFSTPLPSICFFVIMQIIIIINVYTIELLWRWPTVNFPTLRFEKTWLYYWNILI